MTYKIAISEEAEATLREFDDNFEAKIRRLLPSLTDTDNVRIKFSRTDPRRVVLTLGEQAAEWVVVCQTEKKKNTLIVLTASRRQRWPQFSREEAIRIVEAGIGKRPDLPSGAEYVRRIRGVWKGLLPRDRRDS